MPRYRIAGLTVESDTDLYGRIAAVERNSDVVICRGSVPERLAAPKDRGPNWEVDQQRFLLSLPGVARVLVQEGRAIVYEPALSKDFSDTLPFLTGTGFAALLRQRGVLALHAAAVSIGGRALALCGAPGVGTSTLAAALCRNGSDFICDDLAAITFSGDGQPVIWPDGRCWNLHPDSIRSLGLEASRRGSLRAGIDKLAVEAATRPPAGPVPLAAVCVLRVRQPSWGGGIESLSHLYAAQALFDHVYCSRLVLALGQQARHMADTLAILRRVPVFRLTSPDDLGRLDEVAAQILAYMADPGHASTASASEVGGGARERACKQVAIGGVCDDAIAPVSPVATPPRSDRRAAPTWPRGLVWLASYPKSGNTWMRVLLANLLANGERPEDINRLSLSTPIASGRAEYARRTLVDSRLLTETEADRLRPALYRHWSGEDRVGLFLKVHDAYTWLDDGMPLLGHGARRAVYMVRDPRDVAVSLARHRGIAVDAAVAMLNDPDAQLDGDREQVRQRLTGWSGHVRSWLDQAEVSVMVVRYEDLHAEPIRTVVRTLDFLGITVGDGAVECAVRHADFAELQRQEREKGFAERSRSERQFFRQGKVGDWRHHLTEDQVRRIEGAHHEVMMRLGYQPTRQG